MLLIWESRKNNLDSFLEVQTLLSLSLNILNSTSLAWTYFHAGFIWDRQGSCTWLCFGTAASFYFPRVLVWYLEQCWGSMLQAGICSSSSLSDSISKAREREGGKTPSSCMQHKAEEPDSAADTVGLFSWQSFLKSLPQSQRFWNERLCRKQVITAGLHEAQVRGCQVRGMACAADASHPPGRWL